MRHYSIRTERTYRHWVERFLRRLPEATPQGIGMQEVEVFLTDLAVRRNVSPSTQNLALTSLVFFFREVWGAHCRTWISRAPSGRSACPRYCRAEVKALLSAMDGVYAPVAGLMYGTGMRLT